MVVAAAMVFMMVISSYQRQGTSIAKDPSIADERAQHITLDCMDELKAYPMNEGLTRKDFAFLVDALRHSKAREGYSHLPLGYSLVFNMNACLDSKDCIGEHVTISIASQAEREFTCLAITSLLVEESMLSSDNDNETSSALSFETDAEL